MGMTEIAYPAWNEGSTVRPIYGTCHFHPLGQSTHLHLLHPFCWCELISQGSDITSCRSDDGFAIVGRALKRTQNNEHNNNLTFLNLIQVETVLISATSYYRFLGSAQFVIVLASLTAQSKYWHCNEV